MSFEFLCSKQSVRYTFAMATKTAAIFFLTSGRSFIAVFPPGPSSEAAASRWAASFFRSSRPFSNAHMASIPLSRCPSNTYLPKPRLGCSSMLRVISSLAPSASPSSARSSAAMSITSASSGWISSTFMYKFSASSVLPLSANCFARAAIFDASIFSSPHICRMSAFSHRLSGSQPSSSISCSRPRITCCNNSATTFAAARSHFVMGSNLLNRPQGSCAAVREEPGPEPAEAPLGMSFFPIS
mmetsp:Transcript_7381/g.13335  ORF Transcript_7381/g.13335 Transcript_7381/m.13335 type:complete len:242 (+) Transcript_7381:605-1330(+)